MCTLSAKKRPSRPYFGSIHDLIHPPRHVRNSPRTELVGRSGDRGRLEVSGIRSNRRDQPKADVDGYGKDGRRRAGQWHGRSSPSSGNASCVRALSLRAKNEHRGYDDKRSRQLRRPQGAAAAMASISIKNSGRTKPATIMSVVVGGVPGNCLSRDFM